jgi:hypothetical protein
MSSSKSTRPQSKRASAAPSTGICVTLFPAARALDTIHHATCMLEHLTDQMGESDSNESFGQYLLYRSIAQALRQGVESLLDERVSP